MKNAASPAMLEVSSNDLARIAPACYHCGLPVPGQGGFHARVLGADRTFCCVGCETVARTIVDAGFENYYETRDGFGPENLRGAVPQDLPPALIYDDPQAQRQFVVESGSHGREAALILDRIRCAACVWLNEQYLRKLPGVTGVTINYATRRALISWDERQLRLSQIIDAVRALGYDAYPYDPQKQTGMRRDERREALWRLFVAGFGAMQVMMYAVPRYIDDTGTLSFESEQLMRWASLALTIPVMLFACTPFFANALADLRGRRLGVDTPISLGILAAFFASAWATLSGRGEVYFDSISMLVFLLLGARYLELMARQRAAAGLDRLLRWMPTFAVRLHGDDPSSAQERIPIDTLKPGDSVIVAPGDTIPADGIVIHGEGNADESLLTGESRPVPKLPGSTVIGGSVNIDQPLVVQITCVGVDTQAAAIGRLIERAAASKPRLVAAADRIAGQLTWVVLASALVAFAGWYVIDPTRALWVSIAVLVVTCPCALALAAPIALTAATGRLSAAGIVLTRSSAIEAAEAATDVVLDKTGTLTEGRLSLVRVQVMATVDEAHCVALAVALNASSRHPVAVALRTGTSQVQSEVRADQQVHFPGSGVEAVVAGRRYRLGTPGFVAEVAGASTGLPMTVAHRTPVYLGGEAGWLAMLEFEDTPRCGAADAIAALRAEGFRVHLLSGDAPEVVAHHAVAAGIDSWTGGATPQGKHDFVVGLQHRGCRVVMVGDGVNDAPVLAQADVSIAMGEGAPLALMQSDFVLLNTRLSSLPVLLKESRRTMRIIRQNFHWALGYNAIALPMAFTGLIGPWEAAIGMAASSFVVVLNALRLLSVAAEGGIAPESVQVAVNP